MIWELDSTRVLILAILVLWVGAALTRRIHLLRHYNIPTAVTGGLICSVIVTLFKQFGDIEVSFDLSTRDELLLVFFSTIGLTAKFTLLKEGGRILVRLVGITIAFLVLQNLAGILTAMVFGYAPAVGLLGGTISLAGGHGTAITWGRLAQEAGYPQAMIIGLTFATCGLILGGLVGGPVAESLLEKHELASSRPNRPEPGTAPGNGNGARARAEHVVMTPHSVIWTVFLLAVCVGIGDQLNRWLQAGSIVLPGFLTAMGTGIVLSNLADWRKVNLDTDAISLFQEVSLQLFLAMSLMSLHLGDLRGAFLPIVTLLAVQVLLVFCVARWVIFRVCGKDYDAAIMSAGFAGLALGATPVGVANMNAVTSRFGPSPKAFLVIPLVGAFFLDIMNAVVIQTFLSVPGMNP